MNEHLFRSNRGPKHHIDLRREQAEDEHEGADDLADEVGRDEVPREFAYTGKAYGDRKAVNSSLQAHVFAAMNGCPS